MELAVRFTVLLRDIVDTIAVRLAAITDIRVGRFSRWVKPITLTQLPHL